MQSNILQLRPAVTHPIEYVLKRRSHEISESCMQAVEVDDGDALLILLQRGACEWVRNFS